MASKFVVSPMIQKIDLKPGETYEGIIYVANPKEATEDFYYKATVSPYSVTGEDYKADFKTMSDWSRITEWTEIKDAEGVLKPNETKKIHFKIEVPETAPGGGQYMSIGVTSNNPVSGGDGGKVQNVYEMASLVFATVEGDIRHEGKILNTEVPGFVSVGKPEVSARVTNNGNVHETATTILNVKNSIGGGQIYPKDGEDGSLESIIMPMSTRLLSRQIPDLPVLGAFEVTETVSFMGEEVSVTSVMILCPVWFIALVIGVIGSIIGMVFYGKHLRNKKFKKELHSEKTNAKIEP